jgi:DNA polymerase I
MTLSSPDLVLVDGSSYLYRAFHAPMMQQLATARGEPTGAMYIVLNMLLKLIKDYQPQCLAVVFDAPGKTFRDDLFAEYKAHRQPMPDDLRPQIEPLLSMIRANGWPLLRMEGVEADDVIGTLACRAAQAGKSVLISTMDKDMAQLVNGSITLINTMSNSLLDRAGVKAKFDVFPEQIIDYLALVGDSSDNIPGIDKVGPKTAAKWLNQYQTLDNVVANAAQISGKVGENLRAGLKTLELARKLATIHIDLDLPLAHDQLTPAAPDTGTLRELYTHYEFRNLLKQLDGGAAGESATDAPTTGSSPAKRGAPAAGSAVAPGQAAPGQVAPGQLAPEAPSPLAGIERHYETLTRREDLERWLDLLRAADLFAFGVQTTHREYMKAQIVGLSFGVAPGKAAYVPLSHDYTGAPEQLSLQEVLAAVKPLLEDPERAKLGNDLKFAGHVLANHDIQLAGMRYDTMLESYVFNSVGAQQQHDAISATARCYLATNTLAYEDLAGKGAKQLRFNQLPVDKAAEFAAEEIDVTLCLHNHLWPQIESYPRLEKLYEEVEQPLVPVLLRMEHLGVLVDRDLLRAQSREFSQQLQELTVQAHKEAGTEFNMDSPKQLQQILFEKLQIPVTRKTPTGQPSTAEDVLEELAASYPLPRLILEYRALAKLKSTYTDKLPELVDSRTGRIHTSYQQAVAATGRLSSADPNLQNIPIRRPEGRRIRQAFIAPPGYVLMAADYSQIELRIMAHLSGDEGLLAAFTEDRDVHQATAAEVFSVPVDSVTADQRRTAKTINFGLIYGMSPFGLARQLGIDRGSAQRYVERYFARYPGVRRFMEQTRLGARETGYVETVYGRRLYLPDIRSRNAALRQYAERSAINAPMQGTAADIIKRAMVSVDAWCQREDAPARLIMQVHDELVLEVRTEAIESVAAEVRERMTAAGELRVPLKVDVGMGPNWDKAH